MQGINEDVKRKLEEGEASDPFTRRKTKPVLSTGGKVSRVWFGVIRAKRPFRLPFRTVTDPRGSTLLIDRSLLCYELGIT